MMKPTPINQEDFNLLVELAMREEGYSHMRPVIELDRMIARIDEIIHSDSFHNELSRFIPLEVQERTLKKEKFKNFLINETQLLLSELSKLVEGETKQDEFLI